MGQVRINIRHFLLVFALTGAAVFSAPDPATACTNIDFTGCACGPDGGEGCTAPDVPNCQQDFTQPGCVCYNAGCAPPSCGFFTPCGTNCCQWGCDATGTGCATMCGSNPQCGMSCCPFGCDASGTACNPCDPSDPSANQLCGSVCCPGATGCDGSGTACAPPPSSSSSPPGPPACSGVDSFKMLERASRRNSKTTYGPGTGPVCNPYDTSWGTSYDLSNGDGRSNYRLYQESAISPTLIMLRNSALGSTFTSQTGVPVTALSSPYAFIQVGDPLSTVAPIVDVNPAGSPSSRTSLIYVKGIFTREGVGNGSFVSTGWPVTVVSKDSKRDLPNLVSPAAPGIWKTVPTVTPPCLCTSSTDCDTLQTVLPPESPYNDMSYNTPSNANFDQVAPYVVLDSVGPWGFITGQITDTAGNGLPAVAVTVAPGTGGSFAAVEKITDSNGNYKILMNSTGPVVMAVNTETPAGVGTQSTHFFNPIYSSGTVSFTLTSWSAPPNNSITRNFTLGLRPIAVVNPSAVSLTGKVLADTNGNPPVPGVLVNLRDLAGVIVNTARTNTTGTYTFGNLDAAKSYYIEPQGDRNWTVKPAYQLKVGGATVSDFYVGGVAATGTVTTPAIGTLVLFTATSLDPTFPPMIDHRGGGNVTSYSYTAGTNKIANFALPAFTNFNLTCFVPNQSGVYTRSGAAAQKTIGAITGNYNYTCP